MQRRVSVCGLRGIGRVLAAAVVVTVALVGAGSARASSSDAGESPGGGARAGAGEVAGFGADDGGASHALPQQASEAAPQQTGVWEEIAVEGATCGGPPTGDPSKRLPFSYYLSETEEPEGILFMLSGGGACLKEGDPPPGASGPARQLYCKQFSNFRDSYFADATFSTNAIALAVPYVRRGETGNPFRNYVYVAVPYCTGDVHAGMMTEPYDYDPDPEASFEVLHRGHLNMKAVVEDVYRRHPDDLPVVLTGFSAGGFGSIYNFPLVVERWPRTTLVPDAGIAPPHPGSLMAVEGQRVADRWGAERILPDYCNTADCMADTMRLLAAHAEAYDGIDGRPWRPFGYLQGQQDSVLADYLEITKCGYEVSLMQGMVGLGRNVRGFVPATDKHVFGTVNPLDNPFRSERGVDPIGWFGEIATASGPSAMPDDAIDGWMACNAAFTPLLSPVVR